MVSSGHALRLFSDRVMLGHHSSISLKAAMSGGIAHFTLMCFFVGLVTYANTFVAQYCGAGEEKRAGLAVWQAIYLALVGGLVLIACNGLARPLFTWFAHEEAVIREEVTYFRILNLFSMLPLLVAALGALWAGRGRTWIIALIECPVVLINIALNYVLIFGEYGFPCWGIFGAAVATSFSSLVGLVLSALLFFTSENRKRFCTWPKRTLDWILLRQMLRYGSPAGFHICLDLAAFTFFINLLGRLGPLAHEASSVAFSVNAVVFIPMIGLGTSIAVLVGQAIGGREPEKGAQAVRTGCALVTVYALIILISFLTLSGPIIDVFARRGDVAQHEMLEVAKILLRYIAAYMLFDGIWIVINSAIKGAGDTRFSMWAGILMSWGALALPSYVAYRLGADLWFQWKILVGYVMLASGVFYLRYRGGRWKSMSVIDEGGSAQGFQDTAAVGREVGVDGSL
ncbi:MAG: MATE family efflux transporter [Planctomycetota bacterium]